MCNQNQTTPAPPLCFIFSIFDAGYSNYLGECKEPLTVCAQYEPTSKPKIQVVQILWRGVDILPMLKFIVPQFGGENLFEKIESYATAYVVEEFENLLYEI